MCPSVSSGLRDTIGRLGLPERFSSPLMSYSEQLSQCLSPRCIVLYGSLAKGTYTSASDIDLVVVAQDLPKDFHDRLAYLQELNGTRRAIDAFAYTPAEFRDMLNRGHVTALDAVADGIAVHGSSYFQELKRVYQGMVQRGLHRTACSWVLPVSSTP